MNFVRTTTIVVLALVAGTPLARAEGGAAPRRIGFLNPLDRTAPHFDAFKKGLAEIGYEDGRNVVIEPRFAAGEYDRFPQLIAELVAAKVEVLAVTGAVTARAAKKAATGLPIVFAVVVDPIADGVVPDLQHPGGKITGTTSFDPLQAGKQLKLMKEVLPGLKRVALLGDGGVSDALIRASEAQARALGLEALPLRVAAPKPDLDGAFASMKREGVGALLVLEEPLVGVLASNIAAMAARERLPTLFAPSRVNAGGLLAYGTSQAASIRRMATYVQKILNGANPGDLPIERVIPYELIVNARTAQAIGVTVPPAVLARADRVIR